MGRASTRRRFVTALGASAVLGVSRRVFAGPGERFQASVSVDRGSVPVGEQLMVKLQVVAEGSSSAPAPELPESVRSSFDVVQCVPSVSTQVDMFAGRRTQTRSLRCVLVPREPGDHEIAFSIAQGGRRLRSNVVNVQVVEAGTETAPDSATQAPSQPDGDIFLWTTVDKERAYVGEQIIYALDIYEARRFLDPHLRSPPSFQDFFSEELEVPEPTITEVGGVTYRLRPGMRRALFPQRAGIATIGAAEIAVGLRRREVSQPISVEVLPLPAQGQPAGFSPNNVGSYEISASVDRTRVKQGEPLTLTVEIEGTGYIDVIEPRPWPEIEGVRRYDPQVDTERIVGDEVGGRRTFEFLLIPQRGGTITIPAHVLDFFDPSEEVYRSVQTEPLEIEVEGTGEVVAADASKERDPALAGEELEPVIDGQTVPRHQPRERWLTQSRWMYAMAAVPVVSGVGLGIEALWRRFGPDELARARAETRARRRARIEEAQAGLESGEGFHVAVASLLHELAVDRAGPEGVGLPRPQLVRLLERHGVSRDDLRKLEGLLEQCDAARFASQTGTAAERRMLLDDALVLVRRSTLSGSGAP